MENTFGTYMRALRKGKGLTLKQVEKEAKVSNAYLSQIERGLRNPPHPGILRRLAEVYDVTHQELLIEAGYLENPEEQVKRKKLETAYQHAINDPEYKSGTRLKGGQLTLEVKRFIVEMYEKATARKLLE